MEKVKAILDRGVPVHLGVGERLTRWLGQSRILLLVGRPQPIRHAPEVSRFEVLTDRRLFHF
jgi:hypothetical protein